VDGPKICFPLASDLRCVPWPEFEYPQVSEEEQKKSRISIEVVTQGDVHVHSEDYLIGFQQKLTNFHPHFRVQNVNDLVLELRPVFENDQTKTSSLAIVVDGKRVIELSATPGCLVTLRLDPDKLLHARLVTPAPDSCESCVTFRELTL
jgi:hypothetical protein